MTLTIERQTCVEEVVKQLKKVDGIRNIYRDDYTSNTVWFHFHLKLKSGVKRPQDCANPFEVPLRTVTSRVRSAMLRTGMSWDWSDAPTAVREYIPAAYREPGDPASRLAGYNQTRMSVKVYV